MQQSLHLLVVDADRAKALVTAHGGKWLLPILHLPEHARPGLVVEWAAERGLAAQVVGQWLGRAANDYRTVDWLFMMRAGAVDRGVAHMRWIPLACLRTSTAWVDYQQWAVDRAFAASELPTVPGPFGAMTWMQDVEAWIRDVAGAPSGRASPAVIPLRVTAYEIVLEIRSARGTFYFKGLAADRAGEPTLTVALSDIAPESFARTVAQSIARDGTAWWLMEACPGSLLSRVPTREHALRIVSVYGHLQQRIVSYLAEGSRLPAPELELCTVEQWAHGLLRENDDRELDDQRGAAMAGIHSACEHVIKADVPESWLFADFDPRNVVVDGERVRFIDLADSALGPAPVAIGTFVRRMKRFGFSNPDELRHVYAHSWSPALVLNDKWRAFDVISILVEYHLSWKHLLLKCRRGEVYDLPDAARRALSRRLIRAAQVCQVDQPLI